MKMARQDAKVTMRPQPSPQRKLEYLLNETYAKIDELKDLLRKEVALTGVNVPDLAVGHMFSRQDYLVTLCAEACTEQERRKSASNAVSGSVSRRGYNSHTTVSNAELPRSSKVDKDDGKPDGSWYGSLDRSLAKKKKHQLIDKRRRHTKTIGSMAGLDVIKRSAELKPDEQYEIGLPAAPKVSSSRSSIFPMTQHQYYTALMESKKKPAYPLESVRQPRYPPSIVVQRPMNTWKYNPMETLDENKNMKKQVESQHQHHHHHHRQHSQVPQAPKPPNFVPVPCRSLGNEMAFRHSSKSSSSKKWYETNLDDVPSTPVTIQNPSPSPSMLSSTRGSSRGSVASGVDNIDGGIARMTISSPANESTEFTSKSSESSESWSGTGNEVTKPFEMSDYYKYSTKFRNQNSPISAESSPHADRPSIGPPIMHSRQSSAPQIRQPNFDLPNGYKDTNGNPSVGPKLPPKQRRNQNKSISTTNVIFEGDIANGDPSKDVWITNEPTFV